MVAMIAKHLVLLMLVISIAASSVVQNDEKSGGSLLQTFWEENVVPVVGENDFYHLMFGIGIGVGYVYHFGFCLIFAIIDWSDRPGFVTRHKIQTSAAAKDNRNQLDFKRVIKIWKVALFNETFILMPFLLFGFLIRSLRPIPAFHILPSSFTFAYSMAFFIFCDDFFYYILHRWVLHHRKVYKHVHKRHHELTAPIAIGTIYCTPIEHVINLSTLAIGPLILQPHMVIAFTWMIYAITVPLYQHCGYEIPYVFFLFPSASTHDFHHEKASNQMYGKYGFMDYAFGTDRLWKQHVFLSKRVASVNKYKKATQFSFNQNNNTVIERLFE